MDPFEPGTLFERIRARTEHALRCGALEPFASELHVLPEAEVDFVVRLVPGLARKPSPAGAPPTAAPRRNPFLPYDPDLHVADISATHVCLLNKFSVLEHHVLLVTRRFEDQEDPLGVSDFEALWRCMAEFDALGFYNSSPAAGASQPHKHLQMVPVPLGPSGHRTPLDPLVEEARRRTRDVGSSPRLPFRHAVAPCGRLAAMDPGAAARASVTLYRELLRVAAGSGGRPPYNLLATREFLWLVPRSRADCAGIEVNALGFAGALLARDRAELERIRELGPLGVLRRVAFPASRREPPERPDSAVEPR